jgi:hypothetical protein
VSTESNLAGNGGNSIQEAEKFCKRMKVEKELRDAIADITAKLNRSNLSAEEGKRHAKLLQQAYEILTNLEGNRTIS